MSFSFPDPRGADDEGVVAVGGPLVAPRLLVAYQSGIFPWSGDPVRWHSPNPRTIFWRVKLPRRLGKTIRRNGLQVTFDRAFREVVQGCSDTHRDAGEWITPAFVRAYTELHEMGHAHSVEVWQGSGLVGGLYGVQIGGLFAGESMFHRVANASKVAFAALTHHLWLIGTVLYDCQVINEHTYRLGAVLVYRDDYLRMLEVALAAETLYDGGRWPQRGHPSLRGIIQLKDALQGECPAAVARDPRGRQSEPGVRRRLRFWGFERQPGDPRHDRQRSEDDR